MHFNRNYYFLQARIVSLYGILANFMQTHEICPVGFAFVVILHNIRYYFVKHFMPKIVQFLYFVRKIGLFYCNTLKCYIKPRFL